jgi:hypothetical protein
MSEKSEQALEAGWHVVRQYFRSYLSAMAKEPSHTAAWTETRVLEHDKTGRIARTQQFVHPRKAKDFNPQTDDFLQVAMASMEGMFPLAAHALLYLTPALKAKSYTRVKNLVEATTFNGAIALADSWIHDKSAGDTPQRRMMLRTGLDEWEAALGRLDAASDKLEAEARAA